MLSDSKLSKKDKFMRVLLINTSERIGGAAVAASRLMESLKNNGIKAKLLVRDKQTDRITVVSLSHNWRMVWKFVWERIVIWKANCFKRDNIFAVDIANTGTDITTLPEFQQADIIHLHWINQGMLSLKISKTSLPQANLSYGPCTTCGPVQASATMPANVSAISKNVITAPSSMAMAARKTSPTGLSTRNRTCTKDDTSTS